MVGKTIKHYKILERIGGGGMGVVYKAHDTKLDRTVALKFLPTELTSNAEARQRFIQEAKTASTLDHPNICTIHEINEQEDGSAFIAMAYCEGETLKDKIGRGAINPDEAVEIGIQIAKGLSRAHEAGIVHRDVKPANVMMTKRGEIKIVDFGLAKLQGAAKLTKTGATVGTAAYMSPQQAQGDALDRRTDIWSLGVILYEMLAGQVPFKGEYEAAMLYSIVNEKPKSLSELNPNIPLSLDAVVKKALAKKPEERYQSMDELIHDLVDYKKAKESKESIWQLILFKFSNIERKYWITTAASIVIIIVAIILFFLPQKYDIKSLAVLPFRNVGGNSAINYLSDGITKNFINSLSSSNNLRVLQFSSVSEYRDEQNLDSIDGKLNVQAVLTGSVMKSANAITVQARLNLIPKNKEIWSKKYDGNYSDIYNIQDDIVKNLNEIIKLSYNPGVNPTIPRSKSIDAYDLYLKGLNFSDNYKKLDNSVAISNFEQALEKDPTFVSSYIALANSQLMNVEWKWDPDQRWLFKADTNCRKALQLDSSQSGAYSVLGRILLHFGETQKGLDYLERSIVLNPHSAASYSMLGKQYLFSGSPRALTYLMKAHEIEPNSFVTVMNLGIGNAMMKDFRTAARYLRQAIQIDSLQFDPWLNLAFCYEHLVLYDSAVYTYEIALSLEPTDAEVYEFLGAIFISQGKYQKALQTFNNGLQFAHPKHRLLYLLGVTQSLLRNNLESKTRFNEGLLIAKSLAREMPTEAEYQFYAALFHARLGDSNEAIQAGEVAYRIDTTDEASSIFLSRLYAVLRNRQEMLKWFDRAKQLNPEYDESALFTYVDFIRYRNDPELLTIARR